MFKGWDEGFSFVNLKKFAQLFLSSVNLLVDSFLNIFGCFNVLMLRYTLLFIMSKLFDTVKWYRRVLAAYSNKNFFYIILFLIVVEETCSYNFEGFLTSINYYFS